jgi:peptidoglycan DL-endopeptidase CwlO
MTRTSKLTRVLSIAVTVIVAATLVAPGNAVAARSEVDRLRAQLNEINDQFKKAGAAFDKAFWALDETEKSIEDTTNRINANEAELADAQVVLQGRMSAWYRSDDLGFVSFLLGAQDFSDFITRMDYASRISLSDAEAIDRVENLLVELREDRERLEEEKVERGKQVEKFKPSATRSRDSSRTSKRSTTACRESSPRQNASGLRRLRTERQQASQQQLLRRVAPRSPDRTGWSSRSPVPTTIATPGALHAEEDAGPTRGPTSWPRPECPSWRLSRVRSRAGLAATPASTSS